MAGAQRQELLDATNAEPETFLQVFNGHVSVKSKLTLFYEQAIHLRFGARCISESMDLETQLLMSRSDSHHAQTVVCSTALIVR